MTYEITRNITLPTPAPVYVAGQKTAAEFDALIDAALTSSKKRIESVVLYFDTDNQVTARVTFKGAKPDAEASFVFHGRYTDDGEYGRFDLFQFNEGFDYGNGTVIRTNWRTGKHYREFLPGSRTFKSSWGWDLRPIHNALRAIELAGPSLTKVLSENFGSPRRIVATKDGYTVTVL